jgi:glutamate 5-kinase
VIQCSGNFELGDLVEIADESGRVFARGLINYSHEEAGKIRGRKASEIQTILGFTRADELIHRDNLVFV